MVQNNIEEEIMADVSVLMGTYNREVIMKLAIRSILSQTHKDFKFLICDDGSIDKTWKFLEKFAKKDLRIALLRNEVNKGVPFTKNKLLDACETKYACWQDSDDVSNIHRLEIQLKAIEEHSGMIGSKCERVRGLKKEINFYEQPRDSFSGKLGNASLFFPTDKEIRFPEDHVWYGTDAVWRLRMEEKYSTICIDKILYYIRFHTERIGSAKRVYRSLPEEIRKRMNFVDVVSYMKGKKKK